MTSSKAKGFKRIPFVAMLIDTFGFSPGLALAGGSLLTLLCLLAAVWVWRSAPPRTLVLASGPAGSSFERWAQAYQKAFERQGVRLAR